MSHPLGAPAASGAGRDAEIAAIGSLVADPARCRILLAVDDGRALPASGLAAEAGVSPPTASSHLRKLTDAGLLPVEAHGRRRGSRSRGTYVDMDGFSRLGCQGNPVVPDVGTPTCGHRPGRPRTAEHW